MGASGIKRAPILQEHEAAMGLYAVFHSFVRKCKTSKILMIGEKFLVDWLRERKLKKNFAEAQKTRPEYKIPDAIQDNVDIASREFNYGEIPGYGKLLDRNAVAAANSVAAAQQGGNALGSIAGIQAAEGRANENLGIANANYRKANLSNLLGANGQLGRSQDVAWQMNEFAPWADKYQFKNNMADLANQRWTTALDSYNSLGMQVAGAMVGLPPGVTGNFFGGDQNVTPRGAMGR
jgi:hypothetical protein